MYRIAAATAEEALVDYSLSDSGGVTLPPIDDRAGTSATTARRRSALTESRITRTDTSPHRSTHLQLSYIV